ncbi:MutS-related protein [Gabonibacter massiliensis]|uniref:lysine 5,6-aminomutase reactivase ATPase KamC n=1 Tax=Gabonibacter massiliensis TaxID=1720195 RepID=UPI0008A8FBE9|nr:DNA mismatch repair protein MutS [Gabonibacter massiliensis]
MFLVRNAIEEVNGFRFMIDQLEIQSGLAKRVLYATPYQQIPDEIINELNRVEQMCLYLRDTQYADILSRISIKLTQIKDIRGTISRIEENHNLDDIELFELKNFSLLAMDIRLLLETGEIDIIRIPDLEPVIDILDPDKMRIPYFYIYDAYSTELADLRNEIKKLKQSGKADEKQVEKLYFRSILLEDEIREKLSGQLRGLALSVSEALTGIATIDILIAKAKQAIEMHLCKPEIAAHTTSYQGIFNPQIKKILESEQKAYQPIDIEIGKGACLITGANMAGKSVILKTVALAQTLFQFGFFVPAIQAEIALVDEVLLCIGDEQCELNGLSSFASEMLRINRIVQDIKAGKNALILIDELARTTNPAEGKAIVNAVLDFLTENEVRSLITSHYSGIQASCRKLRVKGFMKEKVKGTLTIHNINEYIDYSLIEDNDTSVPQEAMRIARILGVDENLLDRAEIYLHQE